VSRLVVCAGAIRIAVERSGPRLPPATASEGDASTLAQNGRNAAIAGPPAAPVASAAAVRAPLVGVFYRRAEPGKPPMVKIGDRVEAGQPLAIVEA
jgi:biotin carboxyl carrier protein